MLSWQRTTERYNLKKLQVIFYKRAIRMLARFQLNIFIILSGVR